MSGAATNSAVRFYASYALLFSLYGADVGQTQYLLDLGIMPLFFDLLAQYTADSSDEERNMTVEALGSLKMLLYKFDRICDFERVSATVTDMQGWELLKQLARNAEDEVVRRLAGKLTVDRIAADYVADQQDNQEEEEE